jgi:hypothetical protein
LRKLRAKNEREFNRTSLEEQLVERIQAAVQSEETSCLIVGGPGGIGKSVFWESLLEKRPLQTGEDGVWTRIGGPTRVLNLLMCASLDDFKQEVMEVFHPTAFLPNMCMCPEPTFESTLELLEVALKKLPKETPLILFVEDVNQIAEYENWTGPLGNLLTTVGSNGIVVGNSSEVLAYTKFEALSHTGIRTSNFFLPTVPPDDMDLKQYAKFGGHLYQPGFPTKPAPVEDKSNKIAIWNGNLIMIKQGTKTDELNVLTRISQSLNHLELPSKHAHLVNTKMSPAESALVLKLRTELLQSIADAPKNQVSCHTLPLKVKDLKIVEHLAAKDLATFRTLRDETSNEDYEVVAPYHPVVVTQFNRYKAAAAAAAEESYKAAAEEKTWFKYFGIC